jgi:hypothetical protein
MRAIFVQDETYTFKDSGFDGNDDEDEEGEGKTDYFMSLYALS